MKIIVTILCSFLITTCTYAQVITYDDFKSLIPEIQKEDYKSVYEKTDHLLQSTINDSSDLRGMITYMNILSAAGMAFEDQMTREDVGKIISKYVGQKLVMPGHPCIDSTKRSFNSLTFQKRDNQFQGFTMATNLAKTCIFCFEYYEFNQPVNPDDYIGKNIRCNGILKSFEMSTGPLKTWITRLHISDSKIALFIPK